MLVDAGAAERPAVPQRTLSALDRLALEMKWDRSRNLRLRLAKPALGNGRLQTQVRRVFTVTDAPAISASQIYDWCYAKRRLMLGKPLTTRHRYSV
jgi:hypothetical protein